MTEFQEAILKGIPDELPEPKTLDSKVNRAPKRRVPLTFEEKKIALRNALRYFHKKHHPILAEEFARELYDYGHIYMYRFMPDYPIYARPIHEYPYKSIQAASIMHMIQNNLDFRVAQHPYELITYGGNGSVFQNWAQYLLTMQLLAKMTDEQTLVVYSGHPLGLFPSHKDAPRLVVTNGMVIPNYSKQEDYERMYAMGVTQYGQMTAGSYMYIGPQGIIHGTTITILNAARMCRPGHNDFSDMLFVSSGLGGMSGAQPKAAKIAGLVSIIAEINPKAAYKRYEQGWVDEIHTDLNVLIDKAERARATRTVTSFAYLGNVVELWEALDKHNVYVDIASDQTSLHIPFSGGYYPVGLSFEEANEMMVRDPQKFKEKVYQSLRIHAQLITRHTQKGTYFFDYGNAFLLEASRAGAPILNEKGDFIYPSYVQDIMGPLCFDYGFGPFRWICTSARPEDLETTDKIAYEVLVKIEKSAQDCIKTQLRDNIHWIKSAAANKLVVGSQARILYANAEGRIEIAKAFNKALCDGLIQGTIVLGRDHHDVSGTDSPYRETSNIYDGSKFTADMSVQNVIGDSFRGATWVALHNGGGVGWGESLNGGFGLVLDGSDDAERRLKQMLYWDVNNGIARRAWARNPNALFTIKQAMEKDYNLFVLLPNEADDSLISEIMQSYHETGK